MLDEQLAIRVTVASAVGLGVAVALSGAFVWLYNRVFARMREVWFKKFLSLLLLPAGCVAGVVGFARLTWGGPGVGEVATWAVAAALGWGVTIRYVQAMRRQSAWQRASRLEPCRHLRIDPINWERLPRPMAWLLRAAMPLNRAGRLRIHHRRVAVPGLSAAFEGYRVVHLTDFHIHHTMRPEWYDAIVDEALRMRPDVLLFGGDFTSRPEHVARIAGVMSRLRAPDGVWFVRGNHDFWKGSQRVTRQARAAGMRLLSNAGVVLRRGGESLTLIGLETPYVRLTAGEREELRRLPHPRLALVHTPDAFGEAAELGCVVALAGHTHGGQVRLPLFGTTLSSSTAGPLYVSGAGWWGGMLTITSHGQGAFLPLRVLCPPEIVVVELTAASIKEPA
ncbi:MAG: metallophosphoesterase [Candidatus Sumerlaeia bacterium]|nr:metallophosphoesterase [Candidatus Sumerlaeia bacterium]